MPSKTGYYALTAINMIASSYYFNYLFFFLRDRFGYGNGENLWVAALHGAIYIVSAWQCGRYAERRGYDHSLQVGFGGLALCMVAGWFSASAAAVILVLAVYSVVLLFTWPALEALTTAGEPAARVPHMVGVYNCTWAGAAAVAYFTGGPLYDWLGGVAVFVVPGAMFAAAWAYAVWLGRRAVRVERAEQTPDATEREPTANATPAEPENRAETMRFLSLARLANPLSYVAVYTLFAVMPGVAVALGLSPTQVGLFCAVWLFARLSAFAILWQWTAWHYRFRWLVGAYVLLTASFVVILVAPRLWVIVLAQIGFGLAAGLIYYSSLFYSMDVAETRAEHGGLHEAGIGAGILAGPAVGALSISAFPDLPHAAAIAVSLLLVVGLGGLVGLWSRTAPRVR